jgi:hypothetical protein
MCVLWLHEASASGTHLVSLAVQASVRKNFDALKHGGRLVLNDLLQLHTQDQILTACVKADCSGHAAKRFAEGLCK